jgi:hypothetical protein
MKVKRYAELFKISTWLILNDVYKPRTYTMAFEPKKNCFRLRVGSNFQCVLLFTSKMEAQQAGKPFPPANISCSDIGKIHTEAWRTYEKDR